MPGQRTWSISLSPWLQRSGFAYDIVGGDALGAVAGGLCWLLLLLLLGAIGGP